MKEIKYIQADIFVLHVNFIFNSNKPQARSFLIKDKSV